MLFRAGNSWYRPRSFRSVLRNIPGLFRQPFARLCPPLLPCVRLPATMVAGGWRSKSRDRVCFRTTPSMRGGSANRAHFSRFTPYACPNYLAQGLRPETQRQPCQAGLRRGQPSSRSSRGLVPVHRETLHGFHHFPLEPVVGASALGSATSLACIHFSLTALALGAQQNGMSLRVVPPSRALPAPVYKFQRLKGIEEH